MPTDLIWARRFGGGQRKALNKYDLTAEDDVLVALDLEALLRCTGHEVLDDVLSDARAGAGPLESE